MAVLVLPPTPTEKMYCKDLVAMIPPANLPPSTDEDPNACCNDTRIVCNDNPQDKNIIQM
jgi:hypothetical protein